MTTNQLRRNNAGLTMVEVLIASTIFALMAVSLLSYVQYGSQAWKTGHQKLDVGSYYRSVTDTIQRELQQADKVLEPKVNGPASTAMTYDLAISSGSAYVGTATFLLEWVPASRIVRRRIIAKSSTVTSVWSLLPKLTVTTITLVDSDTSNSNTNKPPTNAMPAGYEFTVARDVATFTVTRTSSWTANIAIGIESSMGGEDGRAETKLSTMTFAIPSGR